MTAQLHHLVNQRHAVAVGGLLLIACYFGLLASAVGMWDYDGWMVIVLVPVRVFAGTVNIGIVPRNDTNPSRFAGDSVAVARDAAAFFTDLGRAGLVRR